MEEIRHSERKWDIHMLKIAKLCSEMSKDPSTKVGSVIVSKEHKIISTGYNGFPRDVPDYKDWYHDREIKYKIIIHAEDNALINKGSNEIPENSTIYVWPLKPCKDCYVKLKEQGIKRFVSVLHDVSEDDYCSVCRDTSVMCSSSRWDQTSYYTEEDTVILIPFRELF